MKKYTLEDIERIYNERVKVRFVESELKPGVFAEWSFTYPNGNVSVQVEGSWAMYSENNNPDIAKQVIVSRIKNTLWEIVGKYTLATGEML